SCHAPWVKGRKSLRCKGFDGYGRTATQVKPNINHEEIRYFQGSESRDDTSTRASALVTLCRRMHALSLHLVLTTKLWVRVAAFTRSLQSRRDAAAHETRLERCVIGVARRTRSREGAVCFGYCVSGRYAGNCFWPPSIFCCWWRACIAPWVCATGAIP